MVAKPHIYKTEGLANLEKNPPELADASQYGGRVRCANCVWSFSVGTLAANDRFMGCSLPSWAVPLSIRFKNEDLGSGDIELNCGLWEPGGAFGTSIARSCFALEYNCNLVADERDAELLLQSNKINPNFGEPLWKWAGSSYDTKQDYWIGLEVADNGTPTSSGTKTLVMTVLYALD